MTKTRKSLIELIDLASQRHDGASGRRLAELAQRGGHDISHATLNRLRQGNYATRPSDASIRAIAYLADVSENAAFVAAAVSAPSVYEPPREAQRMTTRQRRALDEMIRAMVPDDAAGPRARNAVTVLAAARQRLSDALAVTEEVAHPGSLVAAVLATIECIDDALDMLSATSEGMPSWHGKAPEDMSDAELDAAAAEGDPWPAYIRTRKAEGADVGRG